MDFSGVSDELSLYDQISFRDGVSDYPATRMHRCCFDGKNCFDVDYEDYH